MDVSDKTSACNCLGRSPPGGILPPATVAEAAKHGGLEDAAASSVAGEVERGLALHVNVRSVATLPNVQVMST